MITQIKAPNPVHTVRWHCLWDGADWAANEQISVALVHIKLYILLAQIKPQKVPQGYVSKRAGIALKSLMGTMEQQKRLVQVSFLTSSWSPASLQDAATAASATLSANGWPMIGSGHKSMNFNREL